MMNKWIDALLLVLGFIVTAGLNALFLWRGIYPGYASGGAMLITIIAAMMITKKLDSKPMPSGSIRLGLQPVIMVMLGSVLFMMLLAVTKPVKAEPFAIGNIPCEVRFSPNGGITEGVIALIDAAQDNVRVLAYNFTSPSIAKALAEAQARGVDVRAVFDRSVPTEKSSEMPTLLAAKIPVRIDKTHRIAHNKVIIVDGMYVETGSFNYTTNAEKSNGENALFCDSQDMAAQYLTDWQTHASHSEVIFAMPAKKVKGVKP